MQARAAFFLCLLTAGLAAGQREEFDSLEAWKPLTFPNIGNHSQYSIQTLENRSVLKAEANASASALVMSEPFNPYETPVLRWRWRVENVLKKGDATRKEGDDYPLRVYVLFTYDPEKASFGMRAKYTLAKTLYGETPPHAALNYIWANRTHQKRILPSPYTDRSQLVVLRAGDAQAGQWVEEEVNILADYRAAFGEDPPKEARLAVMSDADNTGESAVGFLDYVDQKKGVSNQEDQTMSSSFTNHLVGQKSPYLLQHVYNPVDWYPWGEAAFERARRENKPIFLSIGYSTCHWCHVMARESFENEEVAKLLNEHFVSIKVDREERPDIDQLYMTYVQATTGSGGWPMSVWLTPDLKPFFGGTYFPPENKFGRPGFPDILTQIAEVWKSDPQRIVDSAESIMKKLEQITRATSGTEGERTAVPLDQAYERIKRQYDPVYGGFSPAPKFPQPAIPRFLLRYWVRSGQEDAREMALISLKKMAQGGVFDHIGGGFHRYSVDERWHVPHFEKMLYDQSQLAILYTEVYQISHDLFFARVARETLDYVLRNLRGEEGQFYSAEDADSALPGQPDEHAEGAFYVWEEAEIRSVLTQEEADLLIVCYGVKTSGNVRSDPQGEFINKNILYAADVSDESQLATVRKKLLEIRNARPRPNLDDKAVVAWNGLMISALSRAYPVFGDDGYLHAAKKAAAFIQNKLFDKNGHLLHRYRDGEAAIEAFASDYAFLIAGLIDLYEAAFDPMYLDQAIALQQIQNQLFWDEAHGGYFTSTGDDASVLLRMKDLYDGAEPSPNSISLMNLLRLRQLTDTHSDELEAKIQKLFTVFHPLLEQSPSAALAMLSALDFHLGNPAQIILAGDPASSEMKAMLAELHRYYLPNKVIHVASGDAQQELLKKQYSFIDSFQPQTGIVTAYVCENNVCKQPTTDLDEFSTILKELRRIKPEKK